MWTTPRKVRDVMGLDDDAVLNDREMEEIIRIAQEHVKQDLYRHHEETVCNNPGTGASWDGNNTAFQTAYYPIVDTNYDFTVDSNDVTAEWINSNYVPATCSVTVSNATYGLLTITQSGGSAIPADAWNVIVRYYSYHRNITKFQLENLATYLAAHFAHMRLKSGTSISDVDLAGNWRFIIKSPTMYLENYNLIIDQLRNSTIKGV